MRPPGRLGPAAGAGMAAGAGAGRVPQYQAGRAGWGRRASRGGRMSLDRIALRGLRVFGRHGVLEHEQRDGQEFIIDAVLWLDTRAAAANDDLSLTVDYGAVADRLVRPGQRSAGAAHRDAGPAAGRWVPVGTGRRGGRDHRPQAACPVVPPVQRRDRGHPAEAQHERRRERRAGARQLGIPGRGNPGHDRHWAATSATGWRICRVASTRSSTRPGLPWSRCRRFTRPRRWAARSSPTT